MESEIDDDRKQIILEMMHRICAELNIPIYCSDYDPEDFEPRIIKAIKDLKNNV